MVDEHRKLKRLFGLVVQHRGPQHQRRTVVEKRLFVNALVVKLVFLAELFGLDHADPRRFDQKARVDAAAVVAVDEVSLVFRVGLAGGLGVGVDAFGEAFEGGEVLDLDHAYHVRRLHDVADAERDLFHPLVERVGRDDVFLDGRIVDIVEKILDVHPGDRKLAGTDRRQIDLLDIARHAGPLADVGQDRVRAIAVMEHADDIFELGQRRHLDRL